MISTAVSMTLRAGFITMSEIICGYGNGKSQAEGWQTELYLYIKEGYFPG